MRKGFGQVAPAAMNAFNVSEPPPAHCSSHRALVLSLRCRSLEHLQAAGPPFSDLSTTLLGRRLSVTSPRTQDLLFLLSCLPQMTYALPEVPFSTGDSPPSPHCHPWMQVVRCGLLGGPRAMVPVGAFPAASLGKER